MKKFLLLLSVLFLLPALLYSQNPELFDEDMSVRAVAESPFESARLSYNPQNGTLYLLTRYGEIMSVDIESGDLTESQSSSDHNLENVQGFDISTDGKFYIVGNIRDNENFTNTGVVKRAEFQDGNWQWETVAESEPYPLSNTYFDHVMNGVAVSPDDQFVYVNSGSRTDHGEEHDVEGLYPGLREAALTAKVLRIPADTTDAILENDIDSLRGKGFLFAEGTRNSFSLAFDGEGELFATENAGERDDPDEFNWLREGHHYGFPWNIGGNETPMQFEGYVPADDELLPTESGSYDYFYDDPDYPEPPEGVTFTSAILNYGPDGVNYRDTESGNILDAAEQDTAIGSFTAHRSTLGLVFDTTNTLEGDYTGDAFILSFSGIDDDAYLLRLMDDPGEDLMHLELTKTDDGYEMTSSIIASGFISPVDAEMIGNKIYVVEHKNPQWLNSWATTRIWEITMPGIGTDIEQPGEELAQDFSLHQNYPNPFNPETQISYSLSQPGNVQLEIFDALGRKVETLVDSRQTAGQHQVRFNAGNLSSGVYFYRLHMAGSNSGVQTRKMILLQ